MKRLWDCLSNQEFARFHGAISIFSLAGMLAAWTGTYLFHDPNAQDIILIGVVVIASVPLTIELILQILKANFGVDLLALLSIGTALYLGQYWVAVIVVLMLSGGKALEDYATHRASSVLNALARRMPQITHRIDSATEVRDIPVASVAIGDKLRVFPHELCPVDGTVLDGFGSMDESYLTGEPFLIAKAPGATVLSGAINGDSALTIQATRVAGDSRYAKIVEVLHASEEKRPAIRRLGDRIGSWYTPLSIVIATLSWIISGDSERFLAVLVIATPCPLLLAIPVAVIGAVSVSAKRGIVVKDPSILEKLRTCTTLIVDKTGTLTYGRPRLSEVICTGRWSRQFLIQVAASLERYSKHPLSSAILKSAEEEKIPLFAPDEISESPGRGLTGNIAGYRITLTGRSKLPAHLAAELADVAARLECVILIDGELAGMMRFEDQQRAESKPFLAHLKSKHGFEKTVLLSGDRAQEVALFAAGIGISEAHGGKSPEEKVEIVRALTSREQTVYLGDGINDAPAMLNATAGIALGVNSDITAEAAGAVILDSSLSTVDELIHIGNRMRTIALTSAGGGMLLSLIGMGAGACGFLAPIEGAILQECIDLLAIANSLRMIVPTGKLSDFEVPVQKSIPAITSRALSPISTRP